MQNNTANKALVRTQTTLRCQPVILGIMRKGIINIMRKSAITFFVLISIPLSISGCVDCIIQGLDARMCSRMHHNAKIIERHQKQIKEFNLSIRSGRFAKTMSPDEMKNLLGNTCKRFRDEPLPTNLETTLLGNYYQNRFCKLYENNSTLSVLKKEIRHSDKYGTMYFVLTDGNQVLEYFSWPMTYTKKGYRFGYD